MADQLQTPSQYYQIDAYREFLRSEKIPIVETISVDCLTLPLEPWERLGGLGAYLNLAGRGEFVDSYVAEIPQGGQLKPERHMHEEIIHVLSGRGATAVEAGGERHTFEWGPGSLFGIPLNAPHQHFNGSGSEPARFAAVTSLPIILNMFHSVEFVYDNPFVFRGRMGEARYFRGEGEFRAVRPGRHHWETNFVPDLISFELPEWKERGAAGTSINFLLADNALNAHISEMPVGRYKKAHRHDAGAHIFCVTGEGYSLLWLDGEDPVDSLRIDWRPGTTYAPPAEYFHQHFNVAREPSRYMAAYMGSVRYTVLDRFHLEWEGMDKSVSEGGQQIEYTDEEPRIRELYEQELAKRGLPSRMADLLPVG
jgi:gentisate 1,2-dioxygenase